MIAYLLGLFAGIAQPTQTSFNTKIRERLESPYITTYLTTITAIIVMGAVVLVTEGGINIPFHEINQNPAWIWCGGFCGTVIILTSIACMPQLGSAMTVLLTAFGQIMTGIVIDNWGLFNSPEIKLDWTRLIGAVLVIIGVALVSGGSEKKNLKGKALYFLLAILCGIACGTQVAWNGALGVAAGSSMVATLISMSVAMIGILLLTAFIVVGKGAAGLYDNGKAIKFKFEWWMLSGGIVGSLIVGTNAAIAPILGTGIVNILNLVGEMGQGLIIDAVGFLGIEKKPVTLVKLLGMLLMIAGTVIISLL